MQCKYCQILLGRAYEWSLSRGGHFIEVVFKTGLALYATKLIDMSRCVDLECFCSSAGIIVYELSSACICCIESDVIVFSRKPFTRNNRITRF